MKLKKKSNKNRRRLGLRGVVALRRSGGFPVAQVAALAGGAVVAHLVQSKVLTAPAVARIVPAGFAREGATLGIGVALKLFGARIPMAAQLADGMIAYGAVRLAHELIAKQPLGVLPGAPVAEAPAVQGLYGLGYGTTHSYLPPMGPSLSGPGDPMAAHLSGAADLMGASLSGLPDTANGE